MHFRRAYTDTPRNYIQKAVHTLADETVMTLLQHDAMLGLRGGAPKLQRTACRMAGRGQMDLNNRMTTVAPSMKPLGPTAAASTSTSQTAAAPGVILEQPVSQQVYVPSYRVSLFGEALFVQAFPGFVYRGTHLIHHLLIPNAAFLPSALCTRCRSTFQLMR